MKNMKHISCSVPSPICVAMDRPRVSYAHSKTKSSPGLMVRLKPFIQRIV